MTSGIEDPIGLCYHETSDMSDTMDFGTELRTAPRIDTTGGEVKLRFHSLANFLVAYARNVSPSGLFIATEHYLPKGTRFRIVLEFGREDDSVQGFAEVVWLREKMVKIGEPVGMGLKFLYLDPTAQEIFDKVMKANAKNGGGS